MDETKEKEHKDIHQQTKEETEKVIKDILDDGITNDNIDYLYKVIDIHKDIANEEYWKEKEDNMRYRNSGRGMYGNYDMMDNYGRRDYDDSYGRRRRDSRGRFMERGRDRKYRGEEPMEDMYENYHMYLDGKDQYDRGNYGSKEDTMKSLKYMLESVVCFFDMLKEDATSQDEVELIKKYAREISEM